VEGSGGSAKRLRSWARRVLSGGGSGSVGRKRCGTACRKEEGLPAMRLMNARYGGSSCVGRKIQHHITCSPCWWVGRRGQRMRKWRIVTISEIPHVAVSRSPPISRDTTVARTHIYAHAANVWDSPLVQGPFSVAPCHALHVTIRTLHRCMSSRLEDVWVGASEPLNAA
jgi:hypothetical protein